MDRGWPAHGRRSSRDAAVHPTLVGLRPDRSADPAGTRAAAHASQSEAEAHGGAGADTSEDPVSSRIMAALIAASAFLALAAWWLRR
jgi:hypothetical protein